jgi:hypothetical protein
MSHKQIVDVYERTDFARRIVEIVTSKVKSPFCIGLDANWGNGKTTFINEFLAPAAESQHLPMVIFDCFEQERLGDPFLSITQHILQALPIEDGGKFNEVRNGLVQAAKRVAVTGSKVFVKALVKTVLKQGVEDIAAEYASTDQSAIIADETTTAIENYVAEKLENGLKDKAAKENFKKSVFELAKKASGHERILVVVDELDRCRPQFALDVLESVKHILNAEGLIFVFSYHKSQLHSLIKHEFGSEVDAEQYLHKFINLDLILPATQIFESEPHFKLLVKEYFERFTIKSETVTSFVNVLFKLNKVHMFEARTIERICVAFALTNESSIDIRLQILLVVWSVKNPKIFSMILNRQPVPGDTPEKLKITSFAADLKSEFSLVNNNPTLGAYIQAILVGPNKNNTDEWGDISFFSNRLNQYK